VTAPLRSAQHEFLIRYLASRRKTDKWLYRQKQRKLSPRSLTKNLKIGDLKKLGKEIKNDHDLAMELWSTGDYYPFFGARLGPRDRRFKILIGLALTYVQRVCTMTQRIS
jgi:hypothetical protein